VLETGFGAKVIRIHKKLPLEAMFSLVEMFQRESGDFFQVLRI
jgi:hypothetical protein